MAVFHRAMHEEFGTFEFRLDGAPALFASRIQELAGEVSRPAGRAQFEGYFGLFAVPSLAIEIFESLEDLRVESLSRRRYQGMAPLLDGVHALERGWRPGADSLSPRDSVLERMVRMTLTGAGFDHGANGTGGWAAPELRAARELLSAVGARLAAPGANVQDTAEATALVYAAVRGLPTMLADPAARVPVDTSAATVDVSILDGRWPDHAVRLEGDAALDAAAVPVRYRDRLWRRLRTPGTLPSAAAGDVVLSVSTEEGPDGGEAPQGDGDPARHDGHEHHHHHADEELHPLPHEHIEVPLEPVPYYFGHAGRGPAGGCRHREWDYLTRRYLPRWCTVYELALDTAPGNGGRAWSAPGPADLVPRVRRVLDELQPRGFQLIRRELDGDEVDLGEALDAMIDLRRGEEPSDRVYVRRMRATRDVAVLLLVDVSSSTADRVGPDGEAAENWGESTRVLDIELDSASLLMAALDSAGDRCGLFGFSSAGRHEVHLQILKDFDERLTPRLLSRLAAVRPGGSTRLAAAVRHAAERLARVGAETSLLIVLSDGRPYDVDYSGGHGAEDGLRYPSEDTRTALIEAEELGVTPGMLVFDGSGEDYLQDMCDGLHYERLTNVAALPERLLAMYASLLR